MTADLDIHKNNLDKQSFREFIKECETYAQSAITLSQDKKLKNILGSKKPTFKIWVSAFPLTSEIIPNVPWKLAVSAGNILENHPLPLEIDAQLFLDNVRRYINETTYFK